MEAVARRRYTEDEYVELERRAETKSEFINGEIFPMGEPADGETFAMAGAKPRHNAIAANFTIALGGRLRARGSPCIVFSSDQRIRSEATGINTYADVAVACGPRFHATKRDALVNPTVIVE